MDNPLARKEILDAITEENYSAEKAKFGVDVYYNKNPDGSRTWVEVRNGVISNAGINYPGESRK